MSLSPEEALKIGLALADKRRRKFAERWKSYKGEHELPYAPPGVNGEYEALREMAPLPLIRLAVRTPAQRLRVDGLRTGATADTDERTWNVWQANRLDSRQRTVYTHALALGEGIVSVWPNTVDPSRPVINVEDPRSVYVHADPASPHGEPAWAVKTFTEPFVTPLGVLAQRTVSFLYTAAIVQRFVTEANGERTADVPQSNPLGRVPFVRFTAELVGDETDNAEAPPSGIDALMPMQRAIDTMRFNLLLAAQFAAYRQRVVTGFDPVVRDADGNPLVLRDTDGNAILDENGLEQPVTASPGRAGVDRLLVFPGADTKVFDLAESNLSNYVTALQMFVATFSSTAQVPPQYLVGDFSNTSGDLMVATEATLLSHVGDLQTAFGDSWERVFNLANLAMGSPELPLASEVVWADASPKDLAVIGSAMSQMVPNGAPSRMFLEMVPGATQSKVERWLAYATEQAAAAMAAMSKLPDPAEALNAPDDSLGAG